jgi:two-component sensor histidine kinase
MPLVNFSLDLFAFLIVLIIFFSCLAENIKKETQSPVFLLLLGTVMVALIADALFQVCNGNTLYRTVTTVTATLTDCMGYLIFAILMHYLKRNLFRENRAFSIIVGLFDFLCAIFVLLSIANIFHGFCFSVDSSGTLVREDYIWVTRLLPLAALFTIILTITITPDIQITTRLLYLLYPLFPIIGLMLDDIFPQLSFTYLGAMVSILIIYTNIYQEKRKTIANQRTALMISQINPHFMYNTLSTVASMCDSSPKEAKDLIIQFSSYLRQNLNTLSTDQLIPFEQELRHVGCYLKIEKARFKDRVNVVYAIGSKNFELPALTVQPLVENAIKHGITKKKAGGTVKISTYSTEKAHIIEIKDDGTGFDLETVKDSNRVHVGINNVRNRLKNLCNGTLTVKSKVGVGTRITIEIPIKKGGHK